MNKKRIMYVRKSRSDGQFESIEEVLERHEKQLQEFSMRIYGEPILEKYILREVVSGETIEDRPKVKKLLSMVESGEVECVIVIEPQRLTRGSFGDIDRIVNTFKYSNTKIVTPVKTYNLNEKFDRKYFEQELLRGNDYLEYVKEILVRGRRASVESGFYIGSISPYGYDKKKLPKKGFTLVSNNDADNVRYIFDKFISGMGTTTLSKHLMELGIKSQTGKSWTPNMVRNILLNNVYIGFVTYGRRESKKTMKNGEIIKTRPLNDDYIEVKGLHTPIIDKETFDKAQQLLKSSPAKSIRGDKTIKNPLAGLVKCKYCGNNMFRRPYDKRDVPVLVCKTIGCKCVSSDLFLVENRVIDLLKKELLDYKYYISNYEVEHKSSAKSYDKQIKKIDKELNSLKEDLRNALIKYNRNKISEEEYTFLRQYTLEEESRLNGLKMALNDKIQIDELENKRKAVPILENCINEYYNLSVEDKHKLLTAIIDKIIYEKSKGGRWNEEARNNFQLELFLKI